MGRSGDIGEVQPKAAGSSLVAKLANQFALDVIKLAGTLIIFHQFVITLLNLFTTVLFQPKKLMPFNTIMHLTVD